MKLTKKDLIDLYLPKAAGLPDRTACPTGDELALASSEEMDPADRRRVIDHLTVCRDCAEEYRLVQSLRPFAAGAAAELSNRPPIQGLRSGAATRRFPWWQASYGVAAVAMAACLVAGIWALSIHRQELGRIARLEREVAERNQTVASSAAAMERMRRELVALSQPYINAATQSEVRFDYHILAVNDNGRMYLQGDGMDQLLRRRDDIIAQLTPPGP